MCFIDVAVGIVLRRGAILICRRKRDAHLGSLWEFPGGKCESGEAPAECLQRELREELGILIQPREALMPVEHSYPDRNIRLHPFICDLIRGEPTPLASAEIRWVRPADLPSFRFPAANDSLIKWLVSRFASPTS